MKDGSRLRGWSKTNRIYILREWILEQYGNDYLRPGDVVLDVAGGKGSLSWLLTHVDGLTSVVVDPRVTKNNIVRSVDFLRAHPEEARIRAVPDQPTYQPIAALLPKLESKETFESPKHFRILVDDDLVHALRSAKEAGCDDSEEGLAVWTKYWHAAQEIALATHTQGYKETTDKTQNQVVDATEALSLFRRCRLVVGFHPDEATGSCIDLALELGIPFCVVPCCVYASTFPHRRDKDGSKVRDFDGLLWYLKQKAPFMLTAKLKFPGTQVAKNTVLYTLPHQWTTDMVCLPTS